MPFDEARELVDGYMNRGAFTLSAEESLRFIEAWMVVTGVPEDKMRAELERYFGAPLD